MENSCRKLILLFFLYLPSALIAQQICQSAIDATAAKENYVFNLDGSVTDLNTRLIWQRCLVGQTYDRNGTELDDTDDMCLGAPDLHTWEQALQLGEDATGWRIPNLKEAASTIELQCWSPALNLEVFPYEIATVIWTSSPSFADPASSWVLDQKDGATLVLPRSRLLVTRLVSDP